MQIDKLTRKTGHYEIKAARAIDGDTIDCVLCLPFDSLVRVRVRLVGWWAPELNGPNPAAGRLAQAALEKFLKENVCHIFSRSERKDKYGRVLGILYASSRVVEPGQVIGLWQLTQEAHKAEADWIKAQRLSRPGLINLPDEDDGPTNLFDA
jgi:endonuclease YncB( thermonuclease family)